MYAREKKGAAQIKKGAGYKNNEMARELSLVRWEVHRYAHAQALCLLVKALAIEKLRVGVDHAQSRSKGGRRRGHDI
jgi:hypothetical protein